MKIKTCSLVAVLLISTIAAHGFSGMAKAGLLLPMASKAPQGDWEIVPNLSDEFDNAAVDERKWLTTVESWADWGDWESKNVAESGGQLHLTMRYEDRMSNKHYPSGLLRSKEPVLYGYFEARLRAANRVPGTSSAFWAGPQEKIGGAHTEIDFVETSQHPGNLRQIDMSTHVFSLPGQVDVPIHNHNGWTASWNPWGQFHVYGCEWNQKTITWYVDGKEVGSQPNQYWHQPLNVTLTVGLRQPLRTLPSGEGFPTTMDVDYVRVWRLKPSAGNGVH